MPSCSSDAAGAACSGLCIRGSPSTSIAVAEVGLDQPLQFGRQRSPAQILQGLGSEVPAYVGGRPAGARFDEDLLPGPEGQGEGARDVPPRQEGGVCAGTGNTGGAPGGRAGCSHTPAGAAAAGRAPGTAARTAPPGVAAGTGPRTGTAA